MIHGYNTCTSQVRRLHLVWQVGSIGEVAAAQSLLNNLLKDDIVDDGYILNISIYVGNGLEQNKLPFGQHERVCLYRSVPDYDSIISLEASGDQIERLPNIRDEHGRTLVMVSTADDLRDQLRGTEPGPGMNRDVLDEPSLYKLVEDLGADLRNLWKLERIRVVDMFERLNDLRFVNGLVVEGTVLPGQALPDIIFAGPSIPSIPPTSVAPLPTSDPLPSNNIYYPPDAGLEFDQAIQGHGSMDPSMSPSVPITDNVGSQVMASLPSVDKSPGPDSGPSSYPTPSTHHVNTPAAGGPLIPPSACCSPQVYQAVSTPQSVSTPYAKSAATPVGLSMPGSDAGASSYPTPSTNYANSPRLDEPQQQARDQPIVGLLQSCTFTNKNVRLNNNQIEKIIEVGASLLPRDPFEILLPVLDNAGNTSSSLEKLGLPEEWEGINRAVNYWRLLDKDKDKKICLDALARRVAQILLHLNYESLCSRDQHVLRSILDAYYDDPNISKDEKFRRDRFTTYHARLGKWW
ncbi:hypothetical protein KXV27_005650 [Aspergillus fumigatus]|nr:hypothetical protein KXV27_005650 [Aspergillus fumigatus]